jgi:4-amino-4-deoxy-L-arabinose transferase-like glycosyltransferase
MLKNNVDKITISLLLVILVIAAVLTYYPHVNYPFPIHVDEWYHITIAQSIVKTGSVPHLDPYVNLPLIDLEGAYHYLLAIIIVLFHPSIISWACLPAILQVLACLSVFVFVDRLLGRKEAIVCTLLIALLPSSVTIGGPVFLIPENLGLIFIPLALLFAFNLTKFKPTYNYIGLFFVTLFLLYAHPPTALVLLLIVLVYAVFLFFSKVKDEKRRAFYLFAVIFIAALCAIPNYLAYLDTHGASSLSFGSQILAEPILIAYGIMQTIFFFVGFYLLAEKRDPKILSLLVASALIIVIIVAFVNFNVSFGIPYERTYIPLFLLMSIIASSGFVALLRLDNNKRRVGLMLLVIALIITSYLSIHEDLTTPYYHLISQHDYQNFLYIKAHYSANSIAIMDPYTARAFTPITGMHVYVVEPFGPSALYTPLLNNTASFFLGNCTNTAFLRQNNISIVYTNQTCSNPNLTKVINNTYILNR